MGYNINGLDDLSENLKKLAEKGVSELNKGLDKINQDINSKNEKPKVPGVCPYCGAKLSVNSEPVVKCDYCGAEFDNSASRTIADSVFDFVEKQQQIGLEERKRQLEEARIKAEIKREKRKKKNKIKFFLLLIVIFALLLYYYVYTGGNIPMGL